MRSVVDGQFSVPKARVPLSFTGERMTNEMEGQIEYEHLHRYCLARDLCRDLDVLDVASGEGYGSALLARVARTVVGVEIDESSVEHAKANYASPNLTFMAGDALKLPVGDTTVDVVVSFETLEHLADHECFLREVKRVLRPGGLFVVSTPDRLVYSAPFRDPNPYHVHELTSQELADLLGCHFSRFDILLQRPVLGSLLASSRVPGWRTFDRRNRTFIEASQGLARADYLVAVASDGVIPDLGSSLYTDWRRVHDVVADALSLSDVRSEVAAAQKEHARLAALLEQKEVEAQREVAAREAVHAQLEDERQRFNAHLQDLGSALRTSEAAGAEASRHQAEERQRFDAHLQQLECALKRSEAAGAEAMRREAELQAASAEAMRRTSELQAAYDQVVSSALWRATGPARSLGARAPRLSRNLRRLLQVIWWTLTLQIGYRWMLWRRYRASRAAQLQAGPVAADSMPAKASDEQPLAAPSEPHPDLAAAFRVLHANTPIFFPPIADPDVSIIIPAYRGLDDLLTCLRSLSLHRGTEPSFEVVLVDDCPAAQVYWRVPDSGGLIKIVNQENLGFLRSCNRAAERARGRVLCFLNSDTIVEAGWLRSLVEALDNYPRAGLVGGMLLNRDGTIQDAGWRILGNGWGYPLGRGADPRDGAHTYRREVDCVTGACFVIGRSLWDDLRGFDTAYAPAFYEEFDLAFRAKQRGLKIIYEPRSRVVHLGSNSYGPERRDQLSAVNQRTFVARFAEELRLQPNDVADLFALRQVRPEKPVVLVVDHGVPQPDRHAGDVTMMSYLNILSAAGWRVVYGPKDGLAEGPPAEALEGLGVEMIRAPWTIEGWIEENGHHVSAVWLSRPEIAEALIPCIRGRTSATIVYYTHDLHHLRLSRQADLTGDDVVRSEAEQVRVQETKILQAVDHIMTPSAEEGDLIRGLAPGVAVTVLPPYSYDVSELRGRDAAHFASRRDIVFVGGFPHLPNVDAALFMAQEVMPLVWKVEPEARLLLVGYAPPEEVLALAGPRVVVTGQVPSLEPYLDGARLMLAALRYGAGVKGKVVEALKVGLPVVTTPVGAEGIGLEAGKDAIVAEAAPDLAAGVVELLRDAGRCEELSLRGVALIRARFSRVTARRTLETVFSVPRCRVCGSVKLGFAQPDFGRREGFACLDCYALGRAEALGGALLKRFARDEETSLSEVFRRRRDLRIHEFGFVGGISRTLRGFPNYSESEFFPDVAPGTSGPAGIRCEDLTRLTFADESFDVVISQDVMEHVPDPVRAFAETARVLRPGGSHFFTIPDDPDLERSVARAVLREGKVEHLLEPVYHGDPVRSEGALVFTDYGRDLPELVARAGLVLLEHQVGVTGALGAPALRIFEALKPATAYS